MELISRSSKPKRALLSEGASFQTIVSRDAIIIGRYTIAAVGAAITVKWASRLSEMAFDNKHADTSEDKTLNASTKTNFLVTTISAKSSTSLIHVEILSHSEKTQMKGMKSITRNLVEEAVFDIFAAEPHTATKSVENFLFSFAESPTKKLITIGALLEMLNESFNCCSRSSVFMEVLD